MTVEPATALADLAEKLAAGPPPPPPERAGGFGQAFQGIGQDQATGLDELAEIMGIESDTLASGLEAGTSLSDILAANENDDSALAGRLLAGLTLDTYG